MGRVLPGCLGVQGAQGALASLWGHACPRCPARATGGHGSSRGCAPHGRTIKQGPNLATSPRDERRHHKAHPGGTHLLGRGPRWPGWPDLPWEAGGPLKRRGVLSEGEHHGGRAQPCTSCHLQTHFNRFALELLSPYPVPQDMPVSPWEKSPSPAGSPAPWGHGDTQLGLSIISGDTLLCHSMAPRSPGRTYSPVAPGSLAGPGNPAERRELSRTPTAASCPTGVLGMPVPAGMLTWSPFSPALPGSPRSPLGPCGERG